MFSILGIVALTSVVSTAAAAGVNTLWAKYVTPKIAASEGRKAAAAEMQQHLKDVHPSEREQIRAAGMRATGVK